MAKRTKNTPASSGATTSDLAATLASQRATSADLAYAAALIAAPTPASDKKLASQLIDRYDPPSVRQRMASLAGPLKPFAGCNVDALYVLVDESKQSLAAAIRLENSARAARQRHVELSKRLRTADASLGAAQKRAATDTGIPEGLGGIMGLKRAQASRKHAVNTRKKTAAARKSDAQSKKDATK